MDVLDNHQPPTSEDPNPDRVWAWIAVIWATAGECVEVKYMQLSGAAQDNSGASRYLSRGLYTR